MNFQLPHPARDPANEGRASRTPAAPTFIWASAIVGVVLAACSAPDPGSDWAGTRRDSAGVEIIENPTRGLWAQTESWLLEETLRLGSFGEDPDYQFGQIGTIAIGSDGEIIVSDQQLSLIRVFDSTGVFVRSVGSPGSAPGELGRGTSVLLLAPGDALLVPDQRNTRINRFAPDGTSLTSQPLNLARERALRYDWNPTTRVMAAQVRPAPTDEGTVASSRDLVRRVTTSGAFADTLLAMPSGQLFGAAGSLQYFTPEPLFDVTASTTVAYAINSDYRISFFGADQALQRVVQKSHEPRPIGDRDIRAFFSYLDQAWLDNGVPPARLAANHARVSFAENFPAIASFHVVHDGTLWVQPTQSPADLPDEELERYNFIEDFGAPDWDVFDPEGRYLGIVSMPPRFQPRLFHEDEIYGVWRDGLDVQYVIRLRVHRTPD